MPKIEYLGPLEEKQPIVKPVAQPNLANNIEYLGPLESVQPQEQSTFQKVGGAVKEYIDYLEKPYKEVYGKEHPETAKEFVSNLPRNISQTAVGMAKFPYQVVKGVTEPVIQAVTGEKPVLEAGKDLAKHAYGTVEGLGRFMGEPLGLWGWDKAKERWLTDPVGSLLGISPFIKGIKGYSKARGISEQKALEEIIKEADKEGVPLSDVLEQRKLLPAPEKIYGEGFTMADKTPEGFIKGISPEEMAKIKAQRPVGMEKLIEKIPEELPINQPSKSTEVITKGGPIDFTIKGEPYTKIETGQPKLNYINKQLLPPPVDMMSEQLKGAVKDMYDSRRNNYMRSGMTSEKATLQAFEDIKNTAAGQMQINNIMKSAEESAKIFTEGMAKEEALRQSPKGGELLKKSLAEEQQVKGGEWPLRDAIEEAKQRKIETELAKKQGKVEESAIIPEVTPKEGAGKEPIGKIPEMPEGGKEYPKVIEKDLPRDLEGYYNEKANIIYISKRLTPERKAEIINHELEHAFQHQKGELPESRYVSPIQSAKLFMEYFTDPKEVIARATEKGEIIGEIWDEVFKLRSQDMKGEIGGTKPLKIEKIVPATDSKILPEKPFKTVSERIAWHERRLTGSLRANDPKPIIVDQKSVRIYFQNNGNGITAESILKDKGIDAFSNAPFSVDVIISDKNTKRLKELQSEIGNKLFLPNEPIRSPKKGESGQVSLETLVPKRPLDRIIQLPFRAIGGLTKEGKWKPGEYLHKKLVNVLTESKTGYEKVDAVINSIRKGIIDKYGLPKDYVEAKQMISAERGVIYDEGYQFIKQMKDMPEDVKIRINNILQDKNLNPKELKTITEPMRESIIKRGNELVDLGFLDRDVFENRMGEYLHRSYLKHLQNTHPLQWFFRKTKLMGNEFKRRGHVIEVAPEKVAQYEQKGYIKLGDIDRKVAIKKYKFTQMWRDWTKEERASWGEIQDASFNIQETYKLMANDIATGRFFEKIANMGDVASNKPKIGWKQITSDNIKGTKVKKWGNLSGKYVHPEVFRDLMELDKWRNPTNLRKLYGLWKINVTARNPVVHMNNIWANLHLLDMTDTPLITLAEAMKEMATRKGQYELAQKYGLFGMSKYDVELQPFMKDIKELKQSKNPLDWTWTLIRKGDKALRDLYGIEDDIFRYAIFKDRISKGMMPEKAALEAKRWLIDYDISAPVINFMRNYSHPFIAYPYRALPLVVDTMFKKPWKVAKYYTIYEAINQIAQQRYTEEEEKRERAVLPEQMKGKAWIGTDKTIKLPWKDQYGQSLYFDISRKLPGADIFDTAEKQKVFGLPIPAPLVPSGPIMNVAGLLLNKHPYFGYDIYRKSDTPEEIAGQQAKYLYQAFAPNNPLTPLSYSQTKIIEAIKGKPDRIERFYSPLSAILSTIGIKTTPVDVDKMLQFEVGKLRSEIKDIEKNMYSKSLDYQKGRLSDEEIDSFAEKQALKIERIQEKITELMEEAEE